MFRTIALLCALCCAACVSMGTKVEEGQLRQFEKGRTTYFDVVAVLGKPNQTTLASDGSRQVQYVYTQVQSKIENYIPIVAAFTQGATSETSTVTLTFTPQEVLLDYTATTGQTVVGSGFLSGAKQ